MSSILAIHSFRGGTGKSNLSANLATCFGLLGKKVAIFDTDLASPGVHVLFGYEADASAKLLNDHLQEGVPIRKCAHDVTPQQGASCVWENFSASRLNGERSNCQASARGL